MRPFTIVALATLLAGCSALGGKHTPFSIHSPKLSPFAPAATTPVDWQLQIALPQASSALDSPRIAVMPHPGVLEVYPAARWRDPAPRLLRSLVVEAFDLSGRVGGVSGANVGLSADYALAIDLRDFQAEVGRDGTRAAIRLQARLFDLRGNRIVATRAFDETAAAANSDVGNVVAAFETALAQLMPELVNWTITSGNAAWAEMANNASP
ncbi:ABC-type transport auxiliary lipoprotein family protein [Dokdonella sp.]|nr:ABC-type transport auxiliary lipoprotein family protein [Dokdonella sp.]MBX3690637.1 membrane integrity-associated transporter subunit PqiC [Dokdonella sp.]